ncbi:hypothetical protein EV363DRAFT_1483139 [Boletus edulis]|nr:hypothetical protein EV363DRAFT_1483139 [Boletus edulis]
MKEIGASPNKRPYGSEVYTLPVLSDPNTGAFITDSWATAVYLDETYPEKPVFPKGSRGLIRRVRMPGTRGSRRDRVCGHERALGRSHVICPTRAAYEMGSHPGLGDGRRFRSHNGRLCLFVMDKIVVFEFQPFPSVCLILDVILRAGGASPTMASDENERERMHTLAASRTGSVPSAYRFTAGNSLVAIRC